MDADRSNGPELALRELNWLRGLARILVRSDDAADDACQETLIASWRKPLTPDDDARSWLARVLRNVAARAHLRSRRRQRREAAAARAEAQPSAADVVTRFALQQDVARAVGTLDEPYRTAILLRFWDDLPPRAIASRLGVPVETVRTRIKRGLALVRARLDAQHGGRRAWIVPLAAWCGTPAPAVLGAVVTGMKLERAAVAAAAALALLAVIAWPPVDRAPLPLPAAQADGATVTAVLAGEGPTARVVAPGAAAAAPAAADAAADATGCSLVVVTRWHDGSHAEGIGVHLRHGDHEFRSLAEPARTDAAGRVRFAGLVAGSALVELDRATSGTVALVAGATSELTLTIERGLAVQGVVVDARARPVAGAEVLLARGGVIPQATHVAARTDASGRFALRDLRSFHLVGARASGLGTSPFELLHAWRTGTRQRLDLELVLPGRSASLRGVVLDPDGAPVAGAFVRAGAFAVACEPTTSGRAQKHVPVHRLTDANGWFSVGELPAGRLPVHAYRRGFAPGDATVELVEGELRDVVLRLQVGATLCGTVRDASGEPVADAELEWSEAADYPEPSSAETGADGEFRVADLPAGTLTLHVQARERGSARVQVRLHAGQQTSCEVRLAPGHVIAGRLLDHAGSPLAGWLLTAERPEAAGCGYQLYRSGADGAFAIPDLEDRPYRLLVFDGRRPFSARTLAVDDVRPGRGDVVVPERARRLGSIAGRVLLPDGHPAGEAELGLRQDGWVVRCDESVRADGSFTTGPLPAGTFEVTVRLRGYERIVLQRVELSPGESRQLGDLRLRALPASR
jgi:RNA polymerase sigma-70 factor (ECF subfamily)